MTKIAIVILNWNRAKLTLACLDSVISATKTLHSDEVACRVILVDNASKKEELERLQSGLALIPQLEHCAELIVNKRNAGFAGGMNTGILRALDWEPAYVWLLNNDTVIAPDAISALLSCSTASPEVAIMGSTMADLETGLTITAGGYRYYRWLGWSQPCLPGRELTDLPDAKDLKLDYIDGAALWLRGSFIRRISKLPDENFLYFEELLLNQQLSANESIRWCQSSLVYHMQGLSTPTAELKEKSVYHAAFSAFSYTRKHHLICLPTVILARLFGIGYRATIQGQQGVFFAVTAALYDFILRRKRRYD